MYTSYKIEKESRFKEENKKREVARRSSNEKINESVSKEKTKLTYKERLELENLEQEIEMLENQKVLLEKELNSGTLNYDKLETVSNQIAGIIELIDQKTGRWLELATLIK
jgi:ATP-binding cassette subfamily F protein uup